MVDKTFLVFREHGTAWVSGTATRQQPLWDDHAAFMDRLFDTGAILLGGPYADDSQAVLVIQAADEAAVITLLRDDPWETHDIQMTSSIKEWTIFLDARDRQSS